MKRTILFAASLILGLTLAPAAGATTFGYVCQTNNPNGECTGGNHTAGRLNHLRTTYDDVANEFTWKARFAPENGRLPTSGWLVVTPGANPKNHVDEYTILYMDGAQNRVTAYVYNGVNSSNSWQNSASYLGTYGMTTKNHADGHRTHQLAIDASAINGMFQDPNAADYNPNWVGLGFGAKMGVWYHPSAQSFDPTGSPPPSPDFEYDATGRITAFRYNDQGWYDKGNVSTRPIPEPSAAVVFGIGTLLVGASRRRGRA